MLPSDSKCSCWYQTTEDDIRKDEVFPFLMYKPCKKKKKTHRKQYCFSSTPYFQITALIVASHMWPIYHLGVTIGIKTTTNIIYIKCSSLSLTNQEPLKRAVLVNIIESKKYVCFCHTKYLLMKSLFSLSFWDNLREIIKL